MRMEVLKRFVSDRALRTAFVAIIVGAVATPGWGQTLQKVTLRLDWTTLGYHTPFYLGVARGYYKDAGLDVEILEGKGSGTSVNLVGTGADDFAFADATTAARLIAQGLPAKVVMGIFQRSTLALFYARDRGIQAPKDLKSKAVSMCAGDGMSVYLPIYLKAVDLKADDVQPVTVDCTLKYTVVAQRKADAVASYGTAGRPLMQAVGIQDPGKFDYADAGVFLPSHGIIASDKTITQRADVVRRFVSATAKSWQAAQADPDAAVAATVSAKPLLKDKEKMLKDTFADSLQYMKTPGIAGKPFGWQSPEEWQKATDALVEYSGMTRPASVSAFYSNSFVAN
jgi:NitT/TauT family transport system substrate-binding protein